MAELNIYIRKNLGYYDRTFRANIAAIIGLLYIGDLIPEEYRTQLVLFGFNLFFTSAYGYSLLYRVLGKKKRRYDPRSVDM